MDTQTTINEIYSNLAAKGIVATKKEFYKDWLNRSESYFRYLKHNDKKPSADALAICRSNSEYAHVPLKQKKQSHYYTLANEFSDYSNKLDLLIFDNSKTKWMDRMEKEESTTLH